MSSAIRRICSLLRPKTACVFALATLLVSVTPHKASAGLYAAYSSPIYVCFTGIGCCTPGGPPAIVQDMITNNLQINYYMNVLWPNFNTSLAQISDELRNASLLPISIMGAMIDGQTLNQTLLSIQKLSTASLITQTPSDQICRFGTASRSLALSDDKAKTVQLGLSQQMLRRAVMHQQMSSSIDGAKGYKLGRTSDKIVRFNQYKNTYCDPRDSNGTLGSGWCTATTDDRRNKDIEVTRTLYNPLTLNLDFSSAAAPTMTADEQNIIALSNNLFAHDLPVNMEPADFKSMLADKSDAAENKREQFMNYRSLTAKRGVAQNSFAALAAMKAEGSSAATPYLRAMVSELGLDAAAQQSLLGANPSYHAQMEILTRKIYQNPAFYANLMESSANISRQQTAMEGIALMQDRDIYESLRRSEMVLSTLLEMYVMQEQDKFNDKGKK